MAVFIGVGAVSVIPRVHRLSERRFPRAQVALVIEIKERNAPILAYLLEHIDIYIRPCIGIWIIISPRNRRNNA